MAVEDHPDPQAMDDLLNDNLFSLSRWTLCTLNSEPMSDPAPSDKFLFFQPSPVLERLMLPGFLIIFFGWMLYNHRGLTYALYLSPQAYWLAVVAGILASSALTVILLNTYWAYEGKTTRWGARPWKHFNVGSKWWCAYKLGVIFLLCMLFLIEHFTQALPHGLLLHTGTPAARELVVQRKRELSSRYKRDCKTLVVASSTKYRSDNLCLESDQLYAELKVGDILIVEGKANWIGLLVDSPIAVRDADSGLERSVRMSPRQQPALVQLDDETVTTNGTVIDRIPGGTRTDADKNFDDMGLNDVEVRDTPRGEVRTGTLPDGTRVSVRPSADGRPTIEITDTSGNTSRPPKREVRYGDPT